MKVEKFARIVQNHGEKETDIEAKGALLIAAESMLEFDKKQKNTGKVISFSTETLLNLFFFELFITYNPDRSLRKAILDIMGEVEDGQSPQIDRQETYRLGKSHSCRI